MSGERREGVRGHGRDAVAGEAEQADGAEAAERVRLDAPDVVVVEQDDGQVGRARERVGRDRRQLVGSQVEHLHAAAAAAVTHTHMFVCFLTTVCVKSLGLYLPLYMFCCMTASVSGLMALLVLWIFH